MTLSTYLNSAGAMSLTDLSAKIGVTKGRLSQLRDDMNWPPDLAMKAEEATSGALNAADISPTVARARSGLAA